MVTRRTLLRGATAIPLLGGLAGCQTPLTDSLDGGQATPDDHGPALAAAGQFSTYRARLADAVALGYADRHGFGATVAAETFEAFEQATGEYGAHEALEHADSDAYEAFEHAAIEVRDALDDGDHHAAADALDDVRDALRTATVVLAGTPAADALDVLAFGSRTATAAVFAAADEPRVAAAIANGVLSDLGDAPSFDALTEADEAAATSFEEGVRAVLQAGQRERSDAIRTRVRDVLARATEGAARLAETPAHVGALAVTQAQVRDAHLLARLGGPGRGYAHAATLTGYRARVHDVPRLVEAGATDDAAAAAIAVLEHFETSRAHEPLEHADHDAYESFEHGVVDLQAAAEAGDVEACISLVAEVDAALRTGVAALAPTHAAVLEAGFLRARLADAHERFLAGEREAAGDVAAEVFARFERDELGVHEALEHQSHALYERFEHEHLKPLPAAFLDGDGDAASTHVAGAREALLDFEAAAGSAALVSGAEAAVAVGAAFDAAASSALGAPERAATVVDRCFETFEAGAGGFHETLEHADHETYETYERHLVGVRQAAEDGADVSAAAGRFAATAIDATYTIVDGAGGEMGGAAAAVTRDARARYRDGAARTALADASSDAATGLDTALDDLEAAFETSEDVNSAVESAARACQRAQFALVGALDALPATESQSGGAGDTTYSGGPNVVEGVPADADHVVEMTATTYEPADLTVSAGDTVAFQWVGGEPHTVTAYAAEIPGDATYWASGGFESQDAAVEGWADGAGAVLEGESYVHTFETPGTHGYYCIPHEALGMVGTVVVEE